MKVSFPFRAESSRLFGVVRRPIAQVSFWSAARNIWIIYTMIVDTGADYTLLPLSAIEDLKLDLEKETRKDKTFGVGGSETVYLVKKYKIKIGERELIIPVGFLARDDIPPLLGRQECLDKFDLRFSRFITSFHPIK